MKKLLISLVVLSSCMLMSCGGFFSGRTAEDSVQDFASKLAGYVRSNAVDSIKAVYPGLDSVETKFAMLDGDIIVEKTQDPNQFAVTIGNVYLTLSRHDGGIFEVTGSKGFLKFDAAKVEKAKRTGQYKEGLDDMVLVRRLYDTAFDDWLEEFVYNEMKSKVSVTANVNSMDDASVVVTNNSDIDLEPGDYVVRCKLSNYWSMYDDVTGDYESGAMDYGTKTFRGKTVRAHSRVVYSFNPEFGVKGGDVKPNFELTMGSEKLMSKYVPVGNEYDLFLKARDGVEK